MVSQAAFRITQQHLHTATPSRTKALQRQSSHCPLSTTIRPSQPAFATTTTVSNAMKDPRQGSAAIVFLTFYTLTLSFTIYCLFTRRAKRTIFSVFIFNLIRIGANIASLGWAIHLYDNFDWLIASLILGTEGMSIPTLHGSTRTTASDWC